MCTGAQGILLQAARAWHGEQEPEKRCLLLDDKD
jgi:hypothetical protein